MMDFQLDLNTIGAVARSWQDRNFKPDKVRCALQLCEESGEGAKAVGKEKDGIRPKTRGDVGDELGDVILSACALADRCGVDLVTTVKVRLERMLALDFVAHPEEGVPDEPERSVTRTIPIAQQPDHPEKVLRPAGDQEAVKSDSKLEVLGGVVDKMDEHDAGGVYVDDVNEPAGPESFGGEDFPSFTAPHNIDDHTFEPGDSESGCGRCGKPIQQHTRV